MKGQHRADDDIISSHKVVKVEKVRPAGDEDKLETRKYSPEAKRREIPYENRSSSSRVVSNEPERISPRGERYTKEERLEIPRRYKDDADTERLFIKEERVLKLNEFRDRFEQESKRLQNVFSHLRESNLERFGVLNEFERLEKEIMSTTQRNIEDYNREKAQILKIQNELRDLDRNRERLNTDRQDKIQLERRVRELQESKNIESRNYNTVKDDRERCQNNYRDQEYSAKEIEYRLNSLQRNIDNTLLSFSTLKENNKDLDRDLIKCELRLENIKNLIRSEVEERQSVKKIYEQLKNTLNELESKEKYLKEKELKIENALKLRNTTNMPEKVSNVE